MSKYQIGDKVILGKHTPIADGTVMWDEDMEQFVGKVAIIVGNFGVYFGNQCWQVDIDFGVFAWWEKDFISTDKEVITVPEMKACGSKCIKCGDYNPYAEVNQSDGTYKCYGCRN
jgi:hypothetical protein